MSKEGKLFVVLKMNISGKLVKLFFFKDGFEDDTFICNKCLRTKRSPKGYTNLVSHAKTCYGDNFEREALAHLAKHDIQLDKNGMVNKKDLTQPVIDSFFVSSEKERRAYEWIKWIACRNMPLSETDNDITRHFSQFRAFTSKTLRKYIVATANEMVPKISKRLAEAGPLTLLFDGWSCDGTSTHYIAIFAGYEDPHSHQYAETLLAIQPAFDEEQLGANAHIELFESTLELYGREKEDICCLIGDNCSTNRSISNKWNVPLIGCFNHKLNLAVQCYIEGKGQLKATIEKIDKLMGKACNLKAAARLRDLTFEAFGRSLKAKRGNEIRWTSDFAMVRRYVKIAKQLEEIACLEEYLLTAQEKRLIKTEYDTLCMLEVLSVEIQAKGMDVAFCRSQFDVLLEDPNFKCMERHLAPNADIVNNHEFEAGVVKISEGIPLSQEEADACKKLRVKSKAVQDGNESEVHSDEEQLSTMERLKQNAKRRKVQCASSRCTVDYVDVGKLISATSNCCERLFSEAKYIMVPHRRAMSPVVFECLLFLKKNVQFWDIKTVAAAMKREEEDDLYERDDDGFYE